MYIIDYAARAVGGDVVTVVGPCPADWHLYAPTGCCFYVSTTTLNHDDARAACQSMDGDLASISNRAMAEFVYDISSVYTVMQYAGWAKQEAQLLPMDRAMRRVS